MEGEKEEEDRVIFKETVGNGWDILNAVSSQLAGHSVEVGQQPISSESLKKRSI